MAAAPIPEFTFLIEMSAQCKVLVLLIIGCLTILNTVKADWQYLIKRFDWNSTNHEILATPLKPKRIAPGAYGLSGPIKVGVPIGNDYTFEVKVYRSSSGGSNFVLTPFRVRPIPFYTFMNTFYKNLAMKDLQKCSTLPVFKGRYEGPLQAGDYVMDTCMIESSKLPSVLRPGVYKIVLEVSGPLVQLVVELVSQVQ